MQVILFIISRSSITNIPILKTKNKKCRVRSFYGGREWVKKGGNFTSPWRYKEPLDLIDLQVSLQHISPEPSLCLIYSADPETVLFYCTGPTALCCIVQRRHCPRQNGVQHDYYRVRQCICSVSRNPDLVRPDIHHNRRNHPVPRRMLFLQRLKVWISSHLGSKNKVAIYLIFLFYNWLMCWGQH